MEGTLVKEWEGAPGRPPGSRVSTDPRRLTAGPAAVLWVDEERFRQLVAEGVVERLTPAEERLLADKAGGATPPAAEEPEPEGFEFIGEPVDLGHEPAKEPA